MEQADAAAVPAPTPTLSSVLVHARAPIDWQDPNIFAHMSEVAPGWFEAENKEGRRFYYNKKTEKSQWKHPFSGEVSVAPERKTIFAHRTAGEFKVGSLESGGCLGDFGN